MKTALRPLLLLPILGFAAVALATPRSYLLRLRVKSGEVYRYEIRMQNATGISKTNNVTRLEMWIGRVANGKINIASHVISLTVDGKPVTGPTFAQIQKLQPVNVMNDRGETLGVITGGKLVKGGGNTMMGGGFPEKPVKPGDSWKSKVSAGSATANAATIKFVRLEKVNGREVAYLLASTPQEKGVSATPTKMWVDIATGMLSKLEMQASTRQGQSAAQMSIVMTRL